MKNLISIKVIVRWRILQETWKAIKWENKAYRRRK